MDTTLKDTIFLKVFGFSPRNKVIMFLLTHYGFDYSKSDIAKHCGISRVTLDSFFPELIKQKIVVKTRNIGRAILYKINFASPIVKEIVRLDEVLTDKYADRIIEEQKVRTRA